MVLEWTRGTFTMEQEAASIEARAARLPMNQEQFDAKYIPKASESEAKRRLKKTGMRYVHPFTSYTSFKRAFLGFVPILQWLPKYAFKSSIIYDFVGGVTLGVMNVPQGIAYAALAGVPAVCGLYVSLFPPLIYTIFGTSMHNSISAFSAICLLCGLAVKRFTDPMNPQFNETVSFIDDPADYPTPLEVACSLTLLIAFINFAMALLRLEFLTTYLSDQVVSAFTTAACVHVLVSEIPNALGIPNMVKRNGEYGYLVKDLYEIATRITHVNPYACGISVFSIAFLLLGKEGISRLLLRCCGFHYALPYELFLIIIATVCSYCFSLNADPFDIEIVGHITTGMAMPTVPRFDLMSSLIPDALTITELIALGITSVVSSFFPVYPPACSLSRTLLSASIGTKTPLSNIFAAGLVLPTILFIATELEPLPKPVLSCIILVAMYNIFSKLKEPVLLWPVSKIDCSIWVVSFLSTVFIDVTPGLVISVLYALFTTIAREQWPLWHLLGSVQGGLDFEESGRYEKISLFQEMCLFRFDSPLLFMNVHRFKKCVHKAMVQWEREHFAVHIEKLSISINGYPEKEGIEIASTQSRYLIIDCSGFTFVDYMGVNALKEVYLEMSSRGVQVYFAAAKAPVRDLFAKCGFHDKVSKANFFPTIRDAVAIASWRHEFVGVDENSSTEEERLSDATTISK